MRPLRHAARRARARGVESEGRPELGHVPGREKQETVEWGTWMDCSLESRDPRPMGWMGRFGGLSSLMIQVERPAGVIFLDFTL